MKHDRDSTPVKSDSVRKATTLVRTDLLRDQGVDKIRLMSESKFAELVRDLAADATDSSAKANAKANADAPNAVVARAYQSKWDELRASHEDKLELIESGMRRLATTFECIQKAVRALEAEPQASRPAAPTLPPPSKLPTHSEKTPPRPAAIRDEVEVTAGGVTPRVERVSRRPQTPAAAVQTQRDLLREMLL